MVKVLTMTQIFLPNSLLVAGKQILKLFVSTVSNTVEFKIFHISFKRFTTYFDLRPCISSDFSDKNFMLWGSFESSL